MPDRPLDSIKDTLQNPELTDAFRKHLQTEFSTENLAFHEEVEKFNKDLADPKVSDEALRAKMAKLHSEYIKNNSPQQVNISSSATADFEKAMKNLEGASREQMGEMLEVPNTQIVALMGADSMRRFHHTDTYETAKKQVNDRLDLVEKVEQLQARERQLKLNPSVADRAKAIMTDGGMVALIRTAERQREAAEAQLAEVNQKLKGQEVGAHEEHEAEQEEIEAPKVQAPKVQAPKVKDPKVDVEVEAQELEVEEMDVMELESTVGRARSKGVDSAHPPVPKSDDEHEQHEAQDELDVPEVQAPKVKDPKVDVEVEAQELEVEEMDALELESNLGRARSQGVDSAHPPVPKVQAEPKHVSVRDSLGKIGGKDGAPSLGKGIKTTH